VTTAFRSSFRCSEARPRPLSATRSSVRASSQKDVPSDERDTVRIRPRAVAYPCSSPSAGVRRHLPWGSLPFDGINDGDRCVPACLPGTLRSQGFSPSQRFDPTDASWLYFTPHPSIGFRPSELFPRSQPSRLSTRIALLPLLRRVTHRSKPAITPAATAEPCSNCTFDTRSNAFSA
jgi:hypothetical protein